MINLFEYQNKEDFPKNQIDDLELFLDDIWSKREKSSYYNNEEEQREEEQRFIQFLHKGNKLKSNKYVGVIHFEGHTINLLPKIFYDGAEETTAIEVQNINKHILWWLSYCTKIKFPNYLSGLSNDTADFFEILIYMFSKYTKELLNTSIYQKYIEVENELSNVRGTIDFNTYINENLATGRHHKVSCIYDSFEMDNEFNQCIKYVCRLLVSASKNQESVRNLHEILFLLDEVSDVSISSNVCRNIAFNSMFTDFETVRDYCTLFLENSISFNYKSEMRLFAFLLPMEYVFEDFLHGFINREVDGVKSDKQVSTKHLDTDKNFKMQLDMLLQVGDKKYIADAKYKMVYSNRDDKKNGISQSDLYQMTAYAIRFNITDVKLFYPATIHQRISNSKGFIIIKDCLAAEKEITVESHQLQIIKDNFTIDEQESSIADGFESLRYTLMTYLKSVFVIST